MSPTIFFLSCICLLTEGKVAHGQQENGKSTRAEQAKNKVRHHKWWLIETTNNEEGGEYGMDYQDNDDAVPTTCGPGEFMIISQSVMRS